MMDLPEIKLMSRMTESDLHSYNRFWGALWANYIRNKGTTSLTYWAEQFSCPMLFNGILYSLKDLIRTVVLPERNWAEVSLNEDKLIEKFGQDELTKHRQHNKIRQYTPRFKECNRTRLTKTKDGYKDTGLVREGFMLASNTQFYYDVEKLVEHKDDVIEEVNRGMIRMRKQMPAIPMDEASYDSVAALVVESLAEEPELMTMEGNVSDSRGRSIKGALGKVANPIGFKAFRALVTIPHP